MRIIYFLAGWFLCATIQMSCANQVALTGGPRDETPPIIDTLKSFQNYQTSFQRQDIDLYFNEFINLRNPVRQIVISPPLEYLPKFEHRGKRVTIAFSDEEVLKEAATYVINFGESIEDFTEGNKLENFTLVFSTGSFIDSLSVRGRVTDALSGDPVEDVLVMIYESFEDSTVFRERPFYFARTVDNGEFKIENLRSDTFKMVALNDQNLNYLFDPDTEEIGFLDSPIIVTDSMNLDLNLNIFKQASTPRFLSYDVKDQGKIEFQFSSRPKLKDLFPIDSLSYFSESGSNDNLVNIWYSPAAKSVVRIGYSPEDAEVDTVTVRVNLRNTDPVSNQIKLLRLNDNSRTGFHPRDTLRALFDRPLVKTVDTLIFLIDTSRNDSLIFHMDPKSGPGMDVRLMADWYPLESMLLIMKSGAVTDIFGNQNDSIGRYFRIAEEIAFGSIEIQPVNFPDSVPFVCKVISGNTVIKTGSLQDGDKNFEVERLVPGDYSVQIIEDINGNGIWDPGNYLERRQSEKIYNINLESVRENWKIEQLIDYFDLIEPE